MTPEEEAQKVQSEGLKPREGGGSGLGLKKVEQVAEEDLPEALRPTAGIAQPAGEGEENEEGVAGEESLENPEGEAIDLDELDEPGTGFTIVSVVACILLLIGVYILFAHYSKLWMPEMDAHELPQPPSGLMVK